MRKTVLGMAVAIAALGAGCDVETDDDATTSQAVGTLTSCFADLGQYDPSVPLAHRFDSGCATPTPGSYIAYRSWDFGDGGSAFTGGTLTDHTFTFGNSCYKVTLTVWDINGLSATVAHNVLFCSVGPCNPVCPP